MHERNYGNNESVDLDFMINRLTLDTDLAQGEKKEYEYLSPKIISKKMHTKTQSFSQIKIEK